jgi:Icc protein
VIRLTRVAHGEGQKVRFWPRANVKQGSVMLIAQVTDIHLGFEPDNPAEFNRRRLDQVLHRLVTMAPRPDLLLLTGDLADRGDAASYRRLRNALSVCPFPIHAIPGNHDDRATFIAEFPEAGTADGFVQYEAEAGALRLLFIDTNEAGRHAGAFCTVRAHWLKARLAEQTDRPTVIVMHHPPVETGIEWMNTHPDEPWVARFRDALGGAPHVVGILCGHIHRAVSVGWEGQTVSICRSTAPQVALDLRPIDPDVPDGRAMIVADTPGYALHYWNGQHLVTHFEDADDHVLLARYDVRMQALVRELLAERP